MNRSEVFRTSHRMAERGDKPGFYVPPPTRKTPDIRGNRSSETPLGQLARRQRSGRAARGQRARSAQHHNPSYFE
jgi:hypothetical protein